MSKLFLLQQSLANCCNCSERLLVPAQPFNCDQNEASPRQDINKKNDATQRAKFVRRQSAFGNNISTSRKNITRDHKARRKPLAPSTSSLLLVALLATALLQLCQPACASGLFARVRRQSETEIANSEATPSTSSAPEEGRTSAPEQTTTTTPAPKSNKYPPVNFTLVEQLFEEALEDNEVAQKWRKMDKTLTEGVRALLKLVFPHIVSMASDAKVSGNCSGAILKWILNLRNMREWAVKMLDAIGKPGAGILEGSLTMFGNYKQCLKVRAPDEDEIELNDEQFHEYFRGQYCVLQVRPPLPKRRHFYSLNSTIDSLLRKSYKYYEKNVYDNLAELAMAFNFVNIRVDICVPSLCSRDDIQRVADHLMNKVDMRALVQRCDVEPMDNESNLEQTHLVWSMIFIILMLLVLISTLISTLTSMVFTIKSKRKSCLPWPKCSTKSIFTSLSVYRSLSYMKNVHMDRINDSKPVFLYSLRLIIIVWIFLTSLASQLEFQYLRELLSLRNLIMQWPMQLLVNSTLQFDALILLTAFTYAYQNINSNLGDLIKYCASKYSRLMPSIMLFVAITIVTPLLYQNKSPVWHDFVDEPAQVCKSNGLINLTFLQNLLNSSQICLPQTWIFCVELQLCVLAIPLVHALNKNFDNYQGRFKLTSKPVLCLLTVSLFGCLINFVNIYKNSLPAAWFLTFPDRRDRDLYFSAHLYKTWTHVSTFAVGLLGGHLCRCMSIGSSSYGRPHVGRLCSDSVMLLASLATMGALVFGTHSWSLSGVGQLEAPVANALYAALAPLLWAVSLSVILFLVTVPKEKAEQRCSLIQLLTSDVNLVRLGRLSFLAYLINAYVNKFVLAVQEQAIFSSILMLGHTFIGNLVITFALAFVVSALVELPCRRLIKKLLIGSRRQSTNFDIVAHQLNIRTTNNGANSYTEPSQQQQQTAHLNHAAAKSGATFATQANMGGQQQQQQQRSALMLAS